jgi:DNA-binding NarL/FixJ family response regulator
MVLYHLARDLMLVARVSATARAAGSRYRSFPSTEALVAALGDDAGENGENTESCLYRILVDLQLPGVEPARLMEKIRETGRACEVVAYAQHVFTELLEGAKAAGIPRVMTRGQFDRQVNELVA